MTPVHPVFNQKLLQIYQWIGVSDLSEAISDLEKDGFSRAKHALIGSLKIAAIAAACYGIYKCFAQEPFFYNDQLYQAYKDYREESDQAFCPKSVKDLATTLYHEQKNFKTWPLSGKEFVAKHLNENTPMSSEISRYFTEGARQRNDNSFKRFVLQTCAKDQATSSKSCLSILDIYVGGHASEETLENAMNIVSKCSKRTNSFCTNALEKAVKDSLQLESTNEIETLTKKMTKISSANSESFVEKAAAIFEKKLNQLEIIFNDCKTAQASLSYDEFCDQTCKEKTLSIASAQRACYAEANYFEQLDTMFGENQWATERYYRSKAKESLEKIKSELTSFGISVADLCTQFKDSIPCKQHTQGLLSKLLDFKLSEAAIRFQTKKG